VKLVLWCAEYQTRVLLVLLCFSVYMVVCFGSIVFHCIHGCMFWFYCVSLYTWLYVLVLLCFTVYMVVCFGSIVFHCIHGCMFWFYCVSLYTWLYVLYTSF